MRIIVFLILLILSACLREEEVDKGFLFKAPSVPMNFIASNTQELVNTNQDIIIGLTSTETFKLTGSINLVLEIDNNKRLATCTQSTNKTMSCHYTVGSAGDDFELVNGVYITGISLGNGKLKDSSGNIIDPSVTKINFPGLRIAFSNFTLWLDADDETTLFNNDSCNAVINNNDLVRCWRDKAQNISFTNSGTDLPTFRENYFNSKNAIDFNYDEVSASIPINLTNFTTFVVYDVSAWSTLNYFIGSLNSSTDGIGMGFGGSWGANPGAGIFLIGRNGGTTKSLTSNVEPTSFGVATYQNSKSFRDTTENTPYLDINTIGPHSFSTIGKRDDNNNCCHHQGVISEILIFNSILNADQRQRVWCYISEKYTLGFTGCSS